MMEFRDGRLFLDGFDYRAWAPEDVPWGLPELPSRGVMIEDTEAFFILSRSGVFMLKHDAIADGAVVNVWQEIDPDAYGLGELYGLLDYLGVLP